MAEADKTEKAPKGIAGVSFADYVDMSPDERSDFHKRHFRTAARFERAIEGDEGGGKGLATLLVVGVLAGGAFLLWRASKETGRPIFTSSPVDFFRQGPVLAGVVGGGVGAAAAMLTGGSPAKLAMLGAGIGVIGSALNPQPAQRAAARAAPPAPSAPAAVRGHFGGTHIAALPYAAQLEPLPVPGLYDYYPLPPWA